MIQGFELRYLDTFDLGYNWGPIKQVTKLDCWNRTRLCLFLPCQTYVKFYIYHAVYIEIESRRQELRERDIM